VSAVAGESRGPVDRQVILFVRIGVTQRNMLLVRVDLADFCRIGGDEKPQPAFGVDFQCLQRPAARRLLIIQGVSMLTFIRSISSLNLTRSSFC